MAQIPANQKLWIMYVAQAKAKYHVWPSPTAASWVHNHYVQAGGKFVGSERDVEERNRDERYTKNKGEKRGNPRVAREDNEKKREELKKHTHKTRDKHSR
jgi:hypothetical protein